MLEYPIPVVRIVLENDQGEILLLKRANTKYGEDEWCLPGGKVDYNQSIEDACRDEVKQETGLDLDLSTLAFVHYQNNLPIAEGKMHVINLYFSGAFSGDFQINPESSESAWINPSVLSDYTIAFGNEEGIEKYLRD